MDFYELKQNQKIYWKIFIHGYLMYGISNDHKMSMNKALKSLSIDVLNSVANTAVYPPNWATLKSSAAGQKTVRRVT